jgi:hypothetical protein
MGERWGDYIAYVLTKNNVVASWLVDELSGIQNFSNDSNYPCNLSHLGKVVNINGKTDRLHDVDNFDEHNIGEIWGLQY